MSCAFTAHHYSFFYNISCFPQDSARPLQTPFPTKTLPYITSLMAHHKMKHLREQNTSIIPGGKSGLPHWGKATAATRAVLTIPTRVCSVFSPPNNGMAASAFLKDLFNVPTNVDACNCTLGLYECRKSIIGRSCHKYHVCHNKIHLLS